MSDLKDNFFNKDEKKLISAIQDGFKKTITPLTEKLNYIYKSLVDQDLIKPLATAKSLKKITEEGNKVLDKYNVDSYLQENCLLLKNKKLKEKTDVQIFIEASKWVETEGKEKLVEITLHENIPEDLIKELLSLAILYKIKKSTSDK
ncbi:MAG: hypothetical protein OXJ52_09975 [Oligoflexia bacterium]|nr:hypothetical protein [Oligoflexia bacterium]